MHGLLASCGAEPDAQTVSASALRRIWAASLIEATPDLPQHNSPTYKYSASVRQAQMQSDLSFLSPSEEKLVPITTPNPLMVALHQKGLADKYPTLPSRDEAVSPHASPVKPTSPRSYLRRKSAEKRAAASDGSSRIDGNASVRLRLAQSPPPFADRSESGDRYDDDGDLVSSRESSPARPRLKLHRDPSPTPSEESTRTFQEVRASSMPSLSNSSSGAVKSQQGNGPLSPARTVAAAAKLASEGKKDKKGLAFGRNLTPPTKARPFLRKGQGTGGGNNAPSRTGESTRGSSVDRGSSDAKSRGTSSSSSSSGVADAANEAPQTPTSPARGGSLNRLPSSSGGKSGDYFDPLGLFADNGDGGGDNSQQNRSSSAQRRQRRSGSPPGRSHSPPGNPPIGFIPFVVNAQYSPARSPGSASSKRSLGSGGGGAFSTSNRSPGRTPGSGSKARSSLGQQRQHPSPWQSPPRRAQRFMDASKTNAPVEESVPFVSAKSPQGRTTGTPDGSPPPAEGTLSSLEEARPATTSSQQRGRTTSAATTKEKTGGAAGAPPYSSSSFSPSAARRADASSLRAGTLSRKLDELQEFYQVEPSHHVYILLKLCVA